MYVCLISKENEYTCNFTFTGCSKYVYSKRTYTTVDLYTMIRCQVI